MTNRSEYKENLGRLDKDTRRCLLYLEGLIEEKFKLALKAKQPPTPKVDFSRLDSKDDSLQKQIDGLRSKVDVAYELAKEHEGQEKYLKTLTEKAEELFDRMKEHFEELYNTGFYSEGMKRKFRDTGILRRKKGSAD